MPDVDEQHEAPAPPAAGRPVASWGPTFGPETEADSQRQHDHADSDRPQLTWHPPGGPW